MPQPILLGLEVAERATHIGQRRYRRLWLAGGDDFGNQRADVTLETLGRARSPRRAASA